MKCYECGEPSSQRLCNRCAQQRSNEFNDVMSVTRSGSGRNYVADDEVFPQRVEFENGRIVEIAYENGKPFLRVSLKEPRP